MIRTLFLAVCVGVACQPAAWAQQGAARFAWAPGKVLVYHVEQTTAATETVEGKTVDTWAKLKHVKRWQVTGVDASGVATLQMSLQSLRIQTKTPSGETLLFDSAQPEQSTPELREQLAKYVNAPLATLRIDSLGRVIEVKDSRYGPASRFESELPFVLTMSGEAFAEGKGWERNYQITLEPPQGVGEKFAATQKYVCKSAAGDKAVIAVATQLKQAPEAEADQIPLFQLLPEGEIVFDMQNGRLQSALLQVNRELKNHQGPGSHYRFQSTYTEQFVGDR
jgi:hypothetical protein